MARRSRKVSFLGMPAPLTLDLGRFAGVETKNDPSLVAPPWLTEADNITLDTGTVMVRPGLINVAQVGVNPNSAFTGMGIWRMVASTDPDTHVEEGEQRVLFVTQDGEDAHGNPVVILQSLDLSQPGAGFSVVTPIDPQSHEGLLKGVGRPTYFAQLKDVLYGVNGRDGLFLADTATGEVAVAKAVDPLAAPTAHKAFGSLRPAAGWSWQSSDGTKIAVSLADRDVLHPLSGLATGGQIKLAVAATGTNAWAYHAYSTRLDLTSDPYVSDNLLVASLITNASGASALTGALGISYCPVEMILGTTIGGDNTTDPTNAAFAPSASNSLTWRLSATQANQWYFDRLPVDLSAIVAQGGTTTQHDILSKVDYIAFRVTALPGALTVGFELDLSDPVAPGNLPGTATYYVQRGYNSEAGLYGPVSEATRLDAYDFPTTPTPAEHLPNADECRRAQVVVDFTNLSAGVDTVLVYRSVPDPANTDPKLLPYYLVRTVHKSDTSADSDGNPNTYTFYDSSAASDILQNETPDVADVTVQDGDNSPWFILSKGNRMVYLRSLAEPEGVWASNIGFPAQVPTDDFETIQIPGKGGHDVVGHDDGDEIMGGCLRANEVLVFKKRSVYAWNFLAEGTASETWKIERITTPGTIAPRSICEVPGGVVWLSTDGLYYLPADSDVASPFPVSLSVQKAIEAIPPSSRSSVAISYWPLRGWLLVAIPGENQSQNTELLVCNMRQRDLAHPIGTWFGRFFCRNVDGAGGTLLPRLLLADADDLYLSRGNSAAIDRFKRFDDPDAYSDYGSPIQWRLQTGWLELLDGRKFRLVRRQMEWTFDGDDSRASGASIGALLTLETRPNGDVQTYVYNATYAPAGNPPGLLVSGAAGDDMVHASLVGQQVRVTLFGTTTSPVPVRLLMLRLGYIELGIWKG